MTAVDLGPQSHSFLRLYDQPEPRLQLTPRMIGAIAAVAALYAGGGMLLNLAGIDIQIPFVRETPTITLEPPWVPPPEVDVKRPTTMAQPDLPRATPAQSNSSTEAPPADIPAISDAEPTDPGPMAADPGPLSPAVATPAAPPAPQAMIRNPAWLTRPSQDQLGRLYPRRAAAREMDGRALMECRVTAQGAMTGCIVINEAPEGFGFGEAALASTRYFRMSPRTVDGQAVEGAKVRIPMGFNLSQ